MSDNKRRQREREAQAMGHETPEAAAERGRTETTLLGYLRAYVGQWVYVEGARMNYVIHVIDVVADSLGQPQALVYDAGVRVGDWNRQGPRPEYSYAMPCDPPRVLPWQAVDEIGTAPKGWERVAKA